jgi:hypothetical protein
VRNIKALKVRHARMKREMEKSGDASSQKSLSENTT